MIRTERREVTLDGRDPLAVAAEALAAVDALRAALRESQRIASWAFSELRRLQDAHART